MDSGYLVDAPNRSAQAQVACRVEGAESDSEEQDLTDLQLKRLYDDEEIERFLSVFSKHVAEVTLASSVCSKQSKQQTTIARTNDSITQPLHVGDTPVEDSETETDTDEPWTHFHPKPSTNAQANETSPLFSSQEKRPFLLPRPRPKTLSTNVAAWVIPKLPLTNLSPSSSFRVSSARLAGQRLYVATYPLYTPLVSDLVNLAAWTNWNRSAYLCLAWWVLWYFNLLLPALLSRILFSLLYRRLSPYPNLKELKACRTIARSANQLSASLDDYGAGVSFLGTGPWPRMSQNGADKGNRDILRLARTVTKGKIKKAREKTKSVASSMSGQSGSSPKLDGETHANQHQAEDEDRRRSMLTALESIANFHERIRNLYFWRHGKLTWIYALALTIILLLTTITPTQLLAKFTYALIGVLYWFAVPVLLALPSGDRRRIPSPLFDVPTDAEYAMSLMSLRIVNGERVPASYRARREDRRARGYEVDENVDSVTRKDTSSTAAGEGAEREDEKLGQGARGICREVNLSGPANSAADELAAAVGNSGAASPSVGMENEKGSTAELSGPKTDNSIMSLPTIEAPQATPASHKAVPGVLCLDSSTLSFTPMLMKAPHFWTHVERIQSVKKTTRTNGLRVRHLDEHGHGKESVFRFVLKRDQIWVKLVELGDRKHKWRHDRT